MCYADLHMNLYGNSVLQWTKTSIVKLAFEGGVMLSMLQLPSYTPVLTCQSWGRVRKLKPRCPSRLSAGFRYAVCQHLHPRDPTMLTQSEDSFRSMQMKAGTIFLDLIAAAYDTVWERRLDMKASLEDHPRQAHCELHTCEMLSNLKLQCW